MVEHRKYLPQELDYVLSRIAAGWKFDTIAKAFKQDFASHWADRLFTKKQVQYIKNSYKRPPGTIRPYSGPIPDFSASTLTLPPNHAADLEETINTALKVDHFDQIEPEGRLQNNNAMINPYSASTQPTMANTGYRLQEYAEDGAMFNDGPDSPYNFDNTNQSLLAQDLSGRHPSTIYDLLDPMLGSHTGGPPYGVTGNKYQPEKFVGIGTQFSQTQQSTQTAPGLVTHPGFNGYDSHLDTDLACAVPSLENSLLNSAAPEQLLSGEHADQLLQGPAHSLEHVSYGQNPAELGSAQTDTPETILTDFQEGEAQAQARPLQDPLGCSIESTAYIDRSGWWYSGHHDGWCRIPKEHRHDYDGGVYFRNYDSYTQNIYTEQNDHVTGFLLGLCYQLQAQNLQEEAMCLEKCCEEARSVAQQLVDGSLPQGHDLRQAPLSRPHPVVIGLLHDLNNRLPEGYVYDPISQRVVQYNLPHVGDFELTASVDQAATECTAQDNNGQKAS